MKTKLKSVTVPGQFPMNLSVDADKLPISTNELTDLLRDGKPVAFTGQRTPIYQLPNGLYLRAKGFSYRPSDYRDIRTHVLGNHDLLTVKRVEELGLAMSQYRRPFPTRFKEGSAHFYQHTPQADGTFKKKLSNARPHAAMNLDRAITEFYSHRWARSEGLPVDLPIGYAEFPDLDFRHKGINVPSGGFMAIVPTPMDLRLIEILYHLPHLEELQILYGVHGTETDHVFLHALHSMGSILSRFHEKGKTITYYHPMNVKFGLVDDEFNPQFMDEKGRPLISICDLDAMENNRSQSKRVFLARMGFDIEGLMMLPTAFLDASQTPKSIAAKKDDDDQRWLWDLTFRMRDQSKIQPPSHLPGYHALAGYFGIEPSNQIIPYLSTSLFERHYRSGGRIQDLKEDVLLFLLRAKHGMDLRGTQSWIPRFVRESKVEETY